MNKRTQIVLPGVGGIEIKGVIRHFALNALDDGSIPIIDAPARLVDKPHFARDAGGKGVRFRPFGMRLEAPPRIFFK